MKHICTKDDLFFAHYMLHAVPYTEATADALNDLKIEIRNFNRAQAAREERHIIDEDPDGYITRITLPTTVQDAEEAERWFTETERIDYIPSPYDCTGQLFTRWHKTRKREDGRFICYHSIGYDV